MPKRIRVYTEEQKAYWKQWHKDYYQRVGKHKKQVLTEAQKERKRAWTRKRYQEIKDKKIQEAADYYNQNRERVLAQKKARRDSIPGFNQLAYKRRLEKHGKVKCQWRKVNPEKYKARLERYKPRRRELNKLRRSENLRSRIYMLVKRNNPKIRHHTYDLLGCTPDFFRTFLEAQFAPEMNWDNYGSYWTIDHIIPVSSFDLTDPAEVRKAFHYSNCRPLESELNSEKNDSLPGPHQALLV